MLAPFVFALLFTAAPNESVRVRVEDADHHPVAGAWVASWGWDMGSLELEEVREWIAQGGHGRPRTGLRWVVTDAEGSALVTESEFWNDVVALTPSAGGHAFVARGAAKQVVIALRPYRYWHVRVVDPVAPKERPRLPVTFAREIGTSRRGLQFLARVDADVDGVATFGPVDLVDDPEQDDTILTATLDMPCLVPPRTRTTLRELPTDASPLAIPPHGALEIEVVEENGKSSERPIVVEVSSNEFSQLGLPGPYQGTWRKDLVNEHGTIRLEPIGLGLEMKVAVDDAPRQESKGLRTKAIDGTGVVAALDAQDEVRVVRLEVPAGVRQSATVAVRGRALDAEGRPLRDHRLAIQVADAAEERIELGWTRGRSGEDGSFTTRFPIDPTVAGRGTLRLFDQGPADAEVERDVATAAFAVDELSGWRGGAVGDLRFEPLPLLLAGHVVGADGAPRPSAFVELTCAPGDFEADATIPRWWRQRFELHDHRCDSDGRFEIRGFPGKLTWATKGLQVATAPGAPSSHSFPVGARDVELRQVEEDSDADNTQRGAIAGSLRLDVSVPDEVIEVLLEPPGWNEDAKQEAAQSVHAETKPEIRPWWLNAPVFRDPGDRFSSEWIQAGKWNLRVDFATLGQPRRELFRLDDVVIEVGKTFVVPPIDLRGKIKVAQVELFDMKGLPVPTGHVLCRERSQHPRSAEDRSLQELPDYGRFDAGRYVACAVDDWPTLEFLGFGCRRVTKKFESAGTYRLVLPPPIEVRFKLPDGLHLPPSPLTLDVSLRTEQILTGVMFMHGGEPPHGDSATFDEGGMVTVHLPAAATYELSLHVSHNRGTSRSWSWRGYDVLPDLSFNVVESDEPRTFVLPVKQEAIDKAVKELGF